MSIAYNYITYSTHTHEHTHTQCTSTAVPALQGVRDHVMGDKEMSNLFEEHFCIPPHRTNNSLPTTSNRS